MRGLGKEQSRTRQISAHHRIEVDQERTNQQAQSESDKNVDPQHCNRSQVRVPVETTNCLAHRVNSISEGEKGMEETEEGGHHLDGIQARRSGDLKDHNDDTQALTDMLEAGRQHVDHGKEHQRNKDSSPHKGQFRDRLDPDHQIADGDDQSLPNRE